MSARSIHDARVEARRVLSVLDLLRPFVAKKRLARIEHDLKCHLDTFDDLRDAQVQLDAVGKIRKGAPEAGRFHKYLKQRERHLRRWTCKRAKHLGQKRLSKLVSDSRKDVQAWLKDSGPAQANVLLSNALLRAFTTVASRKARIDPRKPRTIHCTRIAFKRYRYMVEGLAPHVPWADQPFLQAMHDYQSLMGDIQDAEVLRKTFQKFIQKRKPKEQVSVKLGNQLLRRRDELIRRYTRAADQLREFEPPKSRMRS